MTVADDAKLVKAYILARKWVPGPPNGANECCLLAAANFALGGNTGNLLDAMRAILKPRRRLVAWNDEQASVEPVLALLDKVIAGGGS